MNVGYTLSKTTDGTKALDIANERGIQRGIYRIESDVMTLALNDPDGVRPKNFQFPPKGSNVVRYVLVRQRIQPAQK